MVALDENGKPVEVPPIAAESEGEKRREREAQLRRRNRLTERDQIVLERGDMRGGTLPGIRPVAPS